MTTPTISLRSDWAADPTTESVRLTPRGRALIVMVLAAAVVLAATVGLLRVAAAQEATSAWVVDAAAAARTTNGAELAELGLARSHTVGAGDTLWDLARAIDPQADPRPIVDRIQQLNGLSSSALEVGRQLWLPVATAAAR